MSRRLPGIAELAPQHSPVSVLREFLSARDATNKQRAIENLECCGPSGLVFAGDACLEMAFSTQNDNEKLSWLDRASQNWRKCIDQQPLYCTKLNSDSAAARTQLAHENVYRWISLLHNLPPQKVVEQTYLNILDLGSDFLTRQQIKDTSARDMEDSQSLRGSFSELSVLALLHRFALRQMDDQSWLAVPALITENCGTRSYIFNSYKWDISVLTQPDNSQPPERTYEIQVKSSVKQYGNERKSYNKNLTLVHISPDLALAVDGPQVSNTRNSILQECFSELLNDDQEATARLDERTEKLLEIIG